MSAHCASRCSTEGEVGCNAAATGVGPYVSVKGSCHID